MSDDITNVEHGRSRILGFVPAVQVPPDLAAMIVRCGVADVEHRVEQRLARSGSGHEYMHRRRKHHYRVHFAGVRRAWQATSHWGIAVDFGLHDRHGASVGCLAWLFVMQCIEIESGDHFDVSAFEPIRNALPYPRNDAGELVLAGANVTPGQRRLTVQISGARGGRPYGRRQREIVCGDPTSKLAIERARHTLNRKIDEMRARAKRLSGAT